MKGTIFTAIGRWSAAAVLAVTLLQPAIAKEGTITAARGGGGPAVTVINGAPLTVNVGDEHSYQIFNADVPGVGQIYPSNSTDTADLGWIVHAGGVQYGPDFVNHPGGSATGSLGAITAYTGRSISPLAGSGTAADPFQVTVSNQLGASGLVSNEVISYVNGDNFYRSRFSLTNNGDGAQDVRVFLGGDIYLAGSDSGVPYLESASNSIGGRDCANPSTYFILFIPQTPADGYSGSGYSSIWSQIGSGSLSNSLSTTSCIDNGAALQWNRSIAAGATASIQAVVSFGEIPSIAQFDITSVTPASSGQGTTVNVTIQGLGFANGMQVGFGAGITVSNLVVVDANTATATLTIAADATIGPRDVTGISADGNHTATLANGFTVTDPGEPPAFEIIQVTPNSGQQGATVNVTIQGVGFAAGMQVGFGAGISVGNLVVVNGTTATATLTIAASAGIGPRNVTGISADAMATDTLVNGFRVTGAGTAPSPAQPVPATGGFALISLLLAMLTIALVSLRRHG